MSSVSWMDVLTETKDTAPPPASPPHAPLSSSPPSSPLRQSSSAGRGGSRTSTPMLSCLNPPLEEEDDDGVPARKVQSPPRKLSRRNTDEDAGSGSERSNESPRRPQRHSVKPSFFVNTDQPTIGDPPIWQAANDGDVVAFKQLMTSESVRYMNKHKDTLLHLVRP